MRRVAKKRPPEFDWAEVERVVEAKRQARDRRADAWTRKGGRVGAGGRSRLLPNRAVRGRGWWWTCDVTAMRVEGGVLGGVGSWTPHDRRYPENDEMG